MMLLSSCSEENQMIKNVVVMLTHKARSTARQQLEGVGRWLGPCVTK